VLKRSWNKSMGPVDRSMSSAHGSIGFQQIQAAGFTIYGPDSIS
jgi:hypothetical protein